MVFYEIYITTHKSIRTYIYVMYSKDSHLKHLISVKDDTIEYLGLLI